MGDAEDDLAVPHNFSVLLYLLLHIFRRGVAGTVHCAFLLDEREKCFLLTNLHVNGQGQC